MGEPINPEAWRWYFNVIGKQRCPIIDTWWQTETGGFMITPAPVTPLKPGSATLPFPGVEADVVREDGATCDPNEDGYLVVKHPWPGMARTVWGDPDRYRQTYWSDFSSQEWYFTGDSARRDEDGYFWIIGRMDDVIKVSGYRLGTAEVSAGQPSQRGRGGGDWRADELRPCHPRLLHSQIRRNGRLGPDGCAQGACTPQVGPIAVPAVIEIVESLPKARSGKIMRRLLRSGSWASPPAIPARWRDRRAAAT